MRLVWIKDNRGGYRAEKWPHDMPYNEKNPFVSKAEVVHIVKPEEAGLDIQSLEKLYPAPTDTRRNVLFDEYDKARETEP